MMKTKSISIISVFLIAALLLSGCSMSAERSKKQSSNTSESNIDSRYQDYYNKKVKYIGNNSEVINLLNAIGVGSLGKYTITLTTDKEPYGLTINYSELKNNIDEVKFKNTVQKEYAFYLLALVDNLSFVDVNYENFNYHLNVEEANKKINGNIKNYGDSPEKLKELNDIIV